MPIEFGGNFGGEGSGGGGGGTSIGTETIQTTPQSTLDLTRENVPLMVDLVAGLMGRPDDPRTRSKALLCLDRAAARLNMRDVLLYKLTEVTYDSFEDGQQSLDLPTNWGWPADTATVYDADDKIIGSLEWAQWDKFRASVSAPVNGVPCYVAPRNQGDATVFISPPVDPSRVGKIILSYYQRCERPSETENIIVTPETREALITGGEAFAMRYRFAKSPAIWQPMMKEFDRCVEDAVASSQRWLQAARLAVWPNLDSEPFTTPNGFIQPSSVFTRWP